MSKDFTASEVQALIRPHTGAVTGFERTARGFMSDLTAIVDCERGPFFVKAVRNSPGGRRDSITREKQVNAFVWPISPALRWHVEDGSWVVLGFEAVEGRPANFGPDSADLRSIVELVECIGRLKLPPVAEGWPETRWDPFVRNDSEAEFFRGETLLHTDINPSNLLVGESGMWAVDWAWPTRGGRPSSIRPSWIFNWWPPDTVPSLRSRGGAQCTAWAEAEPKALDEFAAAQLRMYRTAVGRKPDSPWLHAMVAAGQSWVEHRGVTVD
ncbi:protein kinase [Streptomyces tailanensis]|uniref:protein kinase n=1 Tax=Streptomyces tailanensis TaxID=2569858 RepID=UPI001FE5510A|nr:protein kinase [Streptomyces tailanensis]